MKKWVQAVIGAAGIGAMALGMVLYRRKHRNY